MRMKYILPALAMTSMVLFGCQLKRTETEEASKTAPANAAAEKSAPTTPAAGQAAGGEVAKKLPIDPKLLKGLNAKKIDLKAIDAVKPTGAAAGPIRVVAASDSTILPVGSSYTKGPKNALVTIIEFSEFQCPFCSRVNPTIKQIRDTYPDTVRIVFKHNPLSFHKDAPLAARAALAAGNQGKFWEMHDVLFENMKKLKPADIDGYAQTVGLNMAKFKTDIASPAIDKMVKDDMALAAKVGARGTPNFFVNGVQITGARPFPSFKTTIDEQLKAAKEAVAAGAKPDQVYATMVARNYKAPSARPNARKKGAADDGKTVYKVPVGDSYSKGPKDALVTIIEFSEFQCPFCARVLPTLKKIEETYGDDVRIIFKHNPLPFHKDAPLAAKASLAAGKQGKFWEMHDVLFANMKKLKPADIDGYAASLGLNMVQFKADLQDAGIAKMLADDMKVAKQFGARGTPNFFVNGRQIKGARPFPSFKTVIDEEIKKAKALIAKGTPRSGVYAALTAKGKTKAAAPAPKPGRAPDNTVYAMPISPKDFGKGPADALVTIVEFSEFQCPFCARVNPTIDQITKKYGKDVRVIFKHNPLPFHKDAPLAAQAAIAAGKQGKFWQMHDVLFKNMKKLKATDIDGYAKQIGLDMGRFSSDLNSAETKAQLAEDQKIAKQFGARGTPNFFINGKKLVGAQPLASFTKVIDAELKTARALVAKGTPRAKVYDAVTAKGAKKAAAPAARKPKPDDTKVYNVKVNPNDAVKGNPNAKITIVEFSEFQCPFCSRVNPTIKQIMDTYGDKVRVVFKHNPLSFHKDAPLAAQASIAAGKQGKFWEMHDILFKNQRKLKPADLQGYAQQLGLDMARFNTDMNSEEAKAQVAADQAQAKALQARGTPHFFVNGRRLRGAQPFPRFKALIDEMLKK